MKANQPAVIEELMSKVREGAVDAKRALLSLGEMVSAGLVSSDCAHAAWLEIIETDCRKAPQLQHQHA